MKKFLILFVVIFPFFVSARSGASSYDRSIIYIGAPQTDSEPERVKKISAIFLEDMKKRLAPKMKFTNLSEAYLYSQNADIGSIAKTNNARWVIYGKIESAQKNVNEKADIVMNLYDARAGKDVEIISFRATESESSKFKENIEYIYSKIAEANSFFITASENADFRRSSENEKALLLYFDIAENVPARFHNLQSVARESIFEKNGSPENVYNETLQFVLMRHRDYNSMKRMKAVSKLINTRWFITGVLKKEPDSENIRCTLRLFDAKKETIAEKTEMEANNYESMELLLKRRLQNFILTLSAETDYRRFSASPFDITETVIPDSETPDKKEETYSGSVFDASGILISGYGNIVHISPEGSLNDRIESTGYGIKKFTRSAGIQIDQQGRIYVMDTVEKKILQFYKNGSFLCEFFYGTNANSFITTSGGYVFIPDTGRQLIQVYTKEGSHIRDVPIETDAPISLCLFKGNPVAISSSSGFYTQTFLSQNGSVLQVRYLGISSKTLSITATAMDANENIYCIDSNKEMLFCIAKNGNILWIEKKLPSFNPNKLIAPFSISSDYMGNTLLVIDNKGKRIINMQRKASQTEN